MPDENLNQMPAGQSADSGVPNIFPQQPAAIPVMVEAQPGFETAAPTEQPNLQYSQPTFAPEVSPLVPSTPVESSAPVDFSLQQQQQAMAAAATTAPMMMAATPAENAATPATFTPVAPTLAASTNSNPDSSTTPVPDNHKGLAWLSYLGIFFLIPLFMDRDGERTFLRFHVRQGITLFISELVIYFGASIISMVFMFIPGIGRIIGVLFALLTPLLSIFFFVLAIIGIVNSVQGKFNKLPVIGNFADKLPESWG